MFKFSLGAQEKNRGFSLVEVLVAISFSLLILVAVLTLSIRITSMKFASENALIASTIAEDLVEHIRKKSIDDFKGFVEFIERKNGILYLDQDFTSQFYSPEGLPAALGKLPAAQSLSSITVESQSNSFEITVNIRWKEIGRPNQKDRNYVLATTIAKSGLRSFLQ
ncbi:MAG: type IV pilus modification PilV family protein [Candidatus Caldatribacteriaceae bacterium]